VLSRYVGAARVAAADVVVRVTADCPLIDPALVDRVIEELVVHQADCDYASNVIQRTYPRGLDTEAFFWDTLLRLDRLGTSPAAREHVTIALRAERPALFLRRDITDEQDNSDLRWTVDTPQDMELVRRLYTALDLGARVAPYAEILAYVRSQPELAQLNQGVETWNP
jgi:spore coat polysaccharide biosynthesis protein SpsF